MRDQRVVQGFAGPTQSYMMEVERRLSGTQDDAATATAAIAANADSITALAAVVAGLSFTLNVEFGATGSSITSSSVTFVNVSTSTNLTITTTGGDVLVIIAGGGYHNQADTETSIVGVSFDGSAVEYTSYYTDMPSDWTIASFAGLRLYTGVAAGAHTVNLVHKTTLGGTSRFDGDGNASIVAIEIPV